MLSFIFFLKTKFKFNKKINNCILFEADLNKNIFIQPILKELSPYLRYLSTELNLENDEIEIENENDDITCKKLDEIQEDLQKITKLLQNINNNSETMVNIGLNTFIVLFGAQTMMFISMITR